MPAKTKSKGSSDPSQNAGSSHGASDTPEIPLRNPAVAALLAFLWPGAGHLYQGRTRKGWMFMACIVATYSFGFVIGGSHVVYASWAKNDVRWHYLCQAPVGIMAMPALLQGNAMREATINGRTQAGFKPPLGEFMAPPRRPIDVNHDDELASWYAKHGPGYEMGTWYTMIAGLLNVLVIFDAYAGPLAIPISGKTKRPPPSDDESQDAAAEQEAK